MKKHQTLDPTSFVKKISPQTSSQATASKSPCESEPNSPPQNEVKCFEDIINDFHEGTSASGTNTGPNSPKNSESDLKPSKQWTFISQGTKQQTRNDHNLDHPQVLKKSKHPINRICVTGGPCAGKTTSLSMLNEQLVKMGFRVLVVPEAATMLMKGGAFI